MSSIAKPGALAIICAILISCGGQPNTEAGKTQGADSASSVADTSLLVEVKADEINMDFAKTAVDDNDYVNVDLNQDLSKKSLQELRLLRNALIAKQGYCFMEADLRGFFTAHTKGYDSIMEARYEAEIMNDSSLSAISLTKAEEAFVKKIKALEEEKKKENYINLSGKTLANVNNIVNLFQFDDLSPEFMTKLARNNFAIVPTETEQLFHVYEKNDYHQVPNFVTTDLYLQLYHMYFSYLLKAIEQEKFIPILKDLSAGMYNESMRIAKSAADKETKDLAEHTAVFYAIPYFILTGEKKTIPAQYATLFNEEIEHIRLETDNTSRFLDYINTQFPYSKFKPRGHYTRSEELKKYFRTMMWIQSASMCITKPEQLKRASLMAHLLQNGKSKSNKQLMVLYKAIYEPIVFLIGEPDNISVMDIASFFASNKMNNVADVFNGTNQQKLNAELQTLLKTRNRIKPKLITGCEEKVNFMPQRYLFDNEILQEVVDVTPNAARAFPKALDLFAALGNKSAENILLNEDKEEKNWEKYPGVLNTLKKKFEPFADWDKSVYNKWVKTLSQMQQKRDDYPVFMKTDEWDRKNLNTSLASWTDLKHDAILYGEQPEAAECGGAGPPPPYTLGYVEPNVEFWKSMKELMALTEGVLKRNNLFTEDITSKTNQLKESVQFLYSASLKELKKQKLSEQEYRTIEAIGGSIEYLTLSIVEPSKDIPNWEYIKGPDKSVAVVADVYTRNVPGCKKNGILHEAVGNVNELYVVVEIEGKLYLAKGATFSYYEFTRPLNTRLSDEEWQLILKNKKNMPPVPKWLKDIILPPKGAPKVDELIFYSSGC